MNSKQRLKARFILISGALVGAALVFHLYNIQVIKGDEYVAKADKQYSRPSSSLFDRGSIYFEAKDGTEVSAATINSGYTLFMNPVLLQDPTSAYEAISAYVKVDKNIFMDKAAKNLIHTKS